MQFSLGNIGETASRILASFQSKTGESVFGVDIGSASIKLVQLTERRGVAILETYGEIALGPYANADVGQAVNLPAEKLGEALKDLMRESNAAATSGGVAVPLSASLISVISLPTKNRDDLSSMIPIEARKYIPVPISEVSLDWFVIPEEEAQFLNPSAAKASATNTNVLLVAIRNDILQKWETVATTAGLTPRFFEIEPFSFARSSYEHGTAPIMVIDLGASSTRVYIIEFGIIDVSHTINRGGQDITLALSKSAGLTFAEAEKMKREKGIVGSEVGANALEFIFSEARRIFLTYQRKEGKAISQIVLVGGGAQLKGLRELATRFFDAPVSSALPFEKVSAPAFISDVLKEAGPSFASAVGLALRALQK